MSSQEGSFETLISNAAPVGESVMPVGESIFIWGNVSVILSLLNVTTHETNLKEVWNFAKISIILFL